MRILAGPERNLGALLAKLEAFEQVPDALAEPVATKIAALDGVDELPTQRRSAVANLCAKFPCRVLVKVHARGEKHEKVGRCLAGGVRIGALHLMCGQNEQDAPGYLAGVREIQGHLEVRSAPRPQGPFVVDHPADMARRNPARKTAERELAECRSGQ